MVLPNSRTRSTGVPFRVGRHPLAAISPCQTVRAVADYFLDLGGASLGRESQLASGVLVRAQFRSAGTHQDYGGVVTQSGSIREFPDVGKQAFRSNVRGLHLGD